MSEVELPAPKEISRDALAAADFDVEQFLNEHAQFQSLKDIRRNVLHWEHKLHTELVDTVNENYPEFLNSAESLDDCLGHLESVRIEVLRFRADALRTESSLRAQAAGLKSALIEKKQLAQSEAEIRQILRFCDLVDLLEDQLCRPVSELNVDDFEEWSKMYVLIVQLQKRFAGSGAVQASLKRVHAIRAGLLAVFNDLVADSDIDSNADDKFRLAQAKSWIL